MCVRSLTDAKKYPAKDVVARYQLVLLATLTASSVARSAHAADFFVVTDTLKSQQDAQARAALVGGWVLDTDAYTALAPGLFAVVQGPYSSRPIADQRLKELKAIKTYKAAYVKEAGALRRTHIRQVRTA
jgi:hypothetical protein